MEDGYGQFNDLYLRDENNALNTGGNDTGYTADQLEAGCDAT